MNKKYEVLWSNTAARDYEHIIEYIARDNHAHALKIFKKLRDQASSLYTFPERGRTVPELQAQSIRQYRELIVSPWSMLYRISEKHVYVLAVLDSRRNIEDILLLRLADSKMEGR
jgi:toxin ParE1/3/4